MSDKGSEPAAPPPWMPLATFNGAIQSLRDHGLPPQLDKSAWASRSGSDKTQIISALKFFGLIDHQNRTQEPLRQLHAATPHSDDEKRVLIALLKDAYPAAFKLDLKTATPQMVQNAIVETGASPSTVKRALRFFLKAAQACNVPLGSRLLRDLRERTQTPTNQTPQENTGNAGNGRVRRKKRPAAGRDDPPRDGGTTHFKIIDLPDVGGSLTLSGDFNAFELDGDERDLVYKVIDLMNGFVAQKRQEVK